MFSEAVNVGLEPTPTLKVKKAILMNLTSQMLDAP